MAVQKHQEVKGVVRDSRTVDDKILGGLSQTFPTLLAFGVMIGLVVWSPWTLHLLLPLALIWWASVAFDRQRQVLPYYLPKGLKRTDYNNPKDGASFGYKQADGVLFLGNAVSRYSEVWESISAAKQHRLVFGTTGAGKSEMLLGLYANFLMLGAGCINSDAKGTPAMVSQAYNLARRFGRDPDFLLINYITGGTTIRGNRKDRLTNTANPCSFASVDQISNLFISFLPKSSGDNQIFQDKAITMFTGLVPALVERRDLHNEPLNVPKIRAKVNSLQELLDLALDQDQRLGEKSREILLNYLRTLPNFDFEAYKASRQGKGKPYEIHAEAGRMFSYAQNYFMRALNSLSDTYGHIYNVIAGEVDYLDVVLNRRILLIALPALEKAPAELNNLAKINLANLRGAIAVTMGQKVEGHRLTTLDNLASASETPTGIILDEYGYQATDGFAITMAQARGMNFSITIAGQDFSNLKMGSEQEADAIFGNAVLIVLNIRNLHQLGERVRETVGEADVLVESGLERNPGFVSGYMSKMDGSITRRHRLTPSDLIKLKTGEGYIFVGRNIGTIHYFPWAPLPDKSQTLTLNRFLPVSFEEVDFEDSIKLARKMDRLVTARMQGQGAGPETIAELPRTVRWLCGETARRGGAEDPNLWRSLISELQAKGPKLIEAGQRPETHPETRPQAMAQLFGGIARPPLESAVPQPPAAAPPVPLAPPATAPAGASFSAPSAPPIRPMPPAMRAPLAPGGVPPGIASFGIPPPDAEIDDDDDDRSAWNDGAPDQAPTRMHFPQVGADQWLTNEDLERETPDDHLGDMSDDTCLQRIQDAAAHVDLASRQFMSPSARGPRAAYRGTAPNRDLVSGLRDASTYKPLDGSPANPISTSKIESIVAKVRAQAQTAASSKKKRDD